jgi:hypothetical protein
MNLSNIGKLLRTNTKTHFPVILSVAAGVGTIATAYLTGKASIKAAEIVKAEEAIKGTADNRTQRLKERTKLVWKLYIPAGLSATSTIICIVGANRVETKKTIAAQTAFAVSQQVYSDYRDKVIEQVGENKEQSIRDSIADDRVKKTAPSSEVLVLGSGSVLCYEMFTGRYFNSDMETLKQARNDLNAKLLAHDYATFDDFYYMIGLERTSTSGQIGWESTRLMELQFSTVLTPDGRPCLAFEYNYTKPF